MNILAQFFDVLFPPRKTQVLLRTVTEVDIRRKYLLQKVEGTLCLSAYQDPLIKALVTENKYFAQTQASRLLGTLLSHWLESHPVPVLLIPIPLSKKRERARGYNQITNILNTLPLPESVIIDTSLLKRTVHTIAQTTLDRSKRLKNLDGAFTCNTEKLHAYKHHHLVLVDDVLTTGATIAAARAALTPHLYPTNTLSSVALAH